MPYVITGSVVPKRDKVFNFFFKMLLIYKLKTLNMIIYLPKPLSDA